MFGSEYVWILQEANKYAWWLREIDGCTTEQFLKVVEGIIIVSSYNAIVGNSFSDSGMV